MLRFLTKRSLKILPVLRALFDCFLVKTKDDALGLKSFLDHLCRRMRIGIRVVESNRGHHLVRADMDIDLAVYGPAPIHRNILLFFTHAFLPPFRLIP